MATEVNVSVWCDRDLDAGDRVPGERISITLTGKALELDLCKECQLELLGPVREALDLWGHRPDAPGKVRPSRAAAAHNGESGARKGKPPAGGRPYACLGCELTYASPSGLMMHYRTIHGLATQTDTYGLTCPICGNEAATQTGLGGHGHNQHGVTGVPVLFALAVSQGDPLGIVAARRAVIAASTDAMVTP